MQNNTRYSYAVQPKALSRSGNSIKQILRTGNAEKLEKLIRTGHGYKLIGEYSSEPKIRSLLKAVPFYMARIDMVHEAVAKGQLQDIQVLTKLKSPVYSVLKVKPENLIDSIDNAGAGLLHKAVFYDHLELVLWLTKNFPKSVHVRDKLGRIPLHYVRATTQPDRIWQILIAAGSEVDVEDNDRRTPSYYLESGVEIRLPDRIRHERSNEEFSTKPSNIRIWIHEQDIDRLQQVIWEGQGEKLKTQTSNKPLMKRFLHGIPYIMAVVEEIHKAAIQNNVNKLTKYCRKPVPTIILKSKDRNGATALHKACGLGNEETVDFILSKYPEAVFACDNDGRTPAHYAAAFQRERIYEKLLLVGANENIIEKNGKTPKCYKSLPGVIDESVLSEIPAGPRGGIDNVYPSSFDWNILSNSRNSITQKVDHSSPHSQQDINDEKADLTFEISEEGNDVENNNENLVPAVPSPETVPKTEEDKIKDDADSISRTTIECDTLTDETPETNLQKSPHEEENSLDATHSDQFTFSSSTVDDENKNDRRETRDVLRMSVDDIMKTKNLEQIGHFILEGYGQQLLGVKSDDEQIQEFINHLPIYLKKIELIHYCCQIGNLEELQKYLDRRKFAIARENQSTLYLSPLHVAIAHNRESIVRYLAGRFPETLKVADRLGRTALHYAAIHPDGKYIYNALLTLGADKSICDENGFTAEYYYENFSEDRYKELMSAISHQLKENYHNENKDDLSNPTTILDEFTKFGKSDCDYVSSGDALKTGLSAIIRTRPSKPIKFLADYLHSYKEQKTVEQVSESANNEKENMRQENVAESEETEKKKLGALRAAASVEEQEVREEVPLTSQEPLINKEGKTIASESESKTSPEVAAIVDYELSTANQFQPLNRDKFGQTNIHYAAARTQTRNALLQTLKEANPDLACRDEFYRTPRDVAAFAKIYENVQTIDEYVFHTIVNGETSKVLQWITDGYDHIFDLEYTDHDMMELVEKRGHVQMLIVLRTIPKFEEFRHDLHNALRFGNKFQVMEILRKCGKDAELLARSRNYMYRCSLHIAVLTQKKDVIKFLIRKFPNTLLNMGDNLDRTALHYAMALDKVEQLSSILIKAGANRLAKDLKGRQPSFYFINKDEILQIRDEELS